MVSVAFPIVMNAQNISGISPKYKMEIYSQKGAANKKAVDERNATLKKAVDERNDAFKKAINLNTITAYEQFLAKGFYDNNLNNQAKEKIFVLISQTNTIDAYEQFLAKGFNDNNLNNRVKEKIFVLISQTNTIAAYEKFLSRKYRISKFDNQAIEDIYKLTAQMDAVEGYRIFLKKYPNAADAEKATKRLYEIMYAIAEEENDIASYYGFLVEFPKSQKLLREKAYINMQMLEVERASDEFNEDKDGDDDHELKERIARQLYIEACRAEEGGDNYTFMRKYNTILYSDLFNKTQTAVDLFRDKRMAKLIVQLTNEVRQLNYSVNRMTTALTNKLNDIQKNISRLESAVSASQQNDYSMYYEQMIDLKREQANDWSKYVNSGKAPTGWFGSPKSY